VHLARLGDRQASDRFSKSQTRLPPVQEEVCCKLGRQEGVLPLEEGKTRRDEDRPGVPTGRILGEGGSHRFCP